MNPRVSKHVEDNKNLKLNINLENCALRWFVLYNFSWYYRVKLNYRKLKRR